MLAEAPALRADNPLSASLTELSDVYLHTSSFQGEKQGIIGTGNENLTVNQSPLGAWLCLDLSITLSWTVVLWISYEDKKNETDPNNMRSFKDDFVRQ